LKVGAAAQMSHPFKSIVVGASRDKYRVHVGSGLLQDIGTQLGRLSRGLSFRHPGSFGKNCAVVTDHQVARIYAEGVLTSLREAGMVPLLISLPPGETSKTLGQASAICASLSRAGFDRTDTMLALGGGVVGDLAGFAAAIYLRGIRFINVPTTLTAQCDSSLGGKTGVNTRYGKNLLGAFHPPALVIVDIDALRTLPERVFNEGCAEVIKHGVALNKGLYRELHKTGTSWRPQSDARDSQERSRLRSKIVLKNLQIKAAVVSEDEFESLGQKGRRALLNFGHTIGHAIESAAGYGEILHGEAVALGMLAATRLSVLKAGFPEQHYQNLTQLLRTWNLPTRLPEAISDQKIMKRMRADKKFVGGKIRFVLVTGIGEARISKPDEVQWTDIQSVVRLLA
jgi:3-dehydroquinate synthase